MHREPVKRNSLLEMGVGLNFIINAGVELSEF